MSKIPCSRSGPTISRLGTSPFPALLPLASSPPNRPPLPAPPCPPAAVTAAADEFFAKQLPHNVTWLLTLLFALEQKGACVWLGVGVGV